MSWTRDVRYAFRTLSRSTLYSAMAVLALALGIGANTAIFSVVNGVLLKGLPYEAPFDLVMVWDDSTARGGTNRVPVTPANFIEWRNERPGFFDMAALVNSSFRLTSLDEPLVPLTHRVTPNYFDLLGVEPHLGRTFVSEEGDPGRDRVVVLSYALWQRVYGGDESILGESIALDGEPYTVVGVLRPDFYSVHVFATQPDLWVPLPLAGQQNERRQRGLAVFGRLADGTDLDQAQAAMSTLAARLGETYPETNEGWDARVVSIHEEATGSVRSTLLVLVGAVGFVLLLACANVANLTLARAAGRSSEIALRRALGASGWRLSRQLLVESVVLSIAGGAVGLLVASLGIPPLLRLIPAGAAVPFLDHVSIDGSVLLFTFALSLMTGVLFGLVPAKTAASTNLTDALRLGGRSKAGGSELLGNALVVFEVVVALVLITGAGLMVQSFRNLKGYEPGFDADEILTVRNSTRGDSLSEPHQRIAHFEELVARLGELPGVTGASATSFPPPLNAFRATTFRIPGEETEPGNEPSATVRAVAPDYFHVMGIPVLSGRALGHEDREDGAPVVVINETLARLYFGDRDPVGESLVVVSSPVVPLTVNQVERQIVGVVGSVRTAGTDPAPLPVIYAPHRQAPLPIMNLVMRVAGDPALLVRQAESVAWSMPGDINVYGTEVLSERIDRFEWSSDVSALLLGGFALLALVLGAAGIYAVVSYTVARRTREIGLRIAMGADRASVLTMVVLNAVKLAGIGVAIGILIASFLSRSVGSLLYGVSPNDVGTFAAASGALVAVAAIAALVPALRASRVDPMTALRQE